MARPDRSALFPGIFVLLCLAASIAAEAQQAPRVPTSQVELALRAGNFDLAASLLEPRAQSGDAEAQYQLASLYRSGRGVAHDDVAAFQWMMAAAEQGHVKAQFNLAKMYLAGRGVAVDTTEASTWLMKASAQGYAEASRLLSEVGKPARAAERDSGQLGNRHRGRNAASSPACSASIAWRHLPAQWPARDTRRSLARAEPECPPTSGLWCRPRSQRREWQHTTGSRSNRRASRSPASSARCGR